MQRRDGAYRLAPDLAVAGSPGWAAVARRLLAPGTGLDLPLATDGALRLVEDPGLAEEAYSLEVTPDGITITASTDGGLS